MYEISGKVMKILSLKHRKTPDIMSGIFFEALKSAENGRKWGLF